MQVYEGMGSVRDARCSISDAELVARIERRIDDLSGYPEFDDPSFIKIIVLEPPDALAEINGVLDFNLIERNCDVIESHCEWFELTLVLNDEGAGVIVFISKSKAIDPSLLSYCYRQMELLSP